MNITLSSALAHNTQKTYSHIEKLIRNFYTETGLNATSVDPSITALFTQFLGSSYKPATVRTYLSALSYRFKIRGLPDPTNAFIVKQTVTGLERIKPSMDNRLPITLPILKSLNNVAHTVLNHYDTVLFKAMFSLAFFALLRIGEFTTGNTTHTLNVMHVSVDKNGLVLNMPSFKHSKASSPHTVKVGHQDPTVCPIVHLLAYLRIRPAGPNLHLFIFQNGMSVSRLNFTKVLRMCLKAANIPDKNIRSHSFRIGGATYMAGQGMSDSQIRALGRWRTDAFKRYIRF